MIIVVIYILILLLSYIIGIIGWAIICSIEGVSTYKELTEEMDSSPAFLPIVNVITLAGYVILLVIIGILFLFSECLGLRYLWNKIKDKKLPFKK